MEKQGKYKSI